MDLQQLCQRVTEIARSAGDFIKHEAQHFDRSKVEMKGFNNLVSYVDKQAEAQLVSDLRQALPEAGRLSLRHQLPAIDLDSLTDDVAGEAFGSEEQVGTDAILGHTQPA